MASSLGDTAGLFIRSMPIKNPTRNQEENSVGATGFEIAFCLFLDFGLVRYLAE